MLAAKMNQATGNISCDEAVLLVENGSMTFIQAMKLTDMTDCINTYVDHPAWLQVVVVASFLIMVTVAALGNTVVIWLILTYRIMRSVTNYFLLNVAIADVMTAVFNIMFNFVYFFYGNQWRFGGGYCTFIMFVSHCTVSVHVLTFVAIAIDRYVAIIYPLRPRLSRGVVLSVICGIWILSSLASMPAILVGRVARVTTALMPDGSTWYQCKLDWSPVQDFSYNIFIICYEYFIPLAIVMVTYVRICVRLWSGGRIGESTPSQEDTIQTKKRVVKMLVVVVLLFAMCWLPYHVIFLLELEHEYILYYDGIQYIWLAVFWLAMSNTMINPVVYFWMNKRFRCGFKSFFRWLPWIHYGSEEMNILRNFRPSFSKCTEDTANPPLLRLSRMRSSRNC